MSAIKLEASKRLAAGSHKALITAATAEDAGKIFSKLQKALGKPTKKSEKNGEQAVEWDLPNMTVQIMLYATGVLAIEVSGLYDEDVYEESTDAKLVIKSVKEAIKYIVSDQRDEIKHTQSRLDIRKKNLDDLEKVMKAFK